MDARIDRSEFTSSQLETFAQMTMVVRDCVGKDVLLPASEMIDLFCRVRAFASLSFIDYETAISNLFRRAV